MEAHERIAQAEEDRSEGRGGATDGNTAGDTSMPSGDAGIAFFGHEDSASPTREGGGAASFFDHPMQDTVQQPETPSNVLDQLGIPREDDTVAPAFPPVDSADEGLQGADPAASQQANDSESPQQLSLQSAALERASSYNATERGDMFTAEQQDIVENTDALRSSDGLADEPSQSPGEELFDQIAQSNGQPGDFWQESAREDWLGTGESTTGDEPQSVHDIVEEETVPLVENEDEAQDHHSEERPLRSTADEQSAGQGFIEQPNLPSQPEHAADPGPSLFEQEASGDALFFDRPQGEDTSGSMRSEIGEPNTMAGSNDSLRYVEPLEESTGTQSQANGVTEESAPATTADQVEGEKVEDIWAQALDSGDLDDTWDQAFEEDFEDEDDFAKHMQQRPEPPQRTSSQRYTPGSPAGHDGSQRPGPSSSFSNPYSAAPATYSAAAPVRPTPPQQQEKVKPMEFFAELPTSQVRSRKPQRQVIGPSTPAPPPGQSYGQRPPSSSSSYGPRPLSGSSHQNFAGPGRLDLFPPQPSVPPPQPTSTASPPIQPSQPYATQTSRYSPAPHQTTRQPQPQQQNPSLPQAQSSQLAIPAQPPHPPTLAPRPPPAGAARARSKSPYAAAPSQTAKRSSPYTQSRSPAGPSHPPMQPPSTSSPPDLAPQIPSKPPNNYSPSKAQPAAAPSMPPARQMESNMFEELPPPPAHRFAPRTSSPLAQPRQERPHVDRSFTMPPQRQDPQAQPDHSRHRSQGDEHGEGQPHAGQRSAPPPAAHRYSPSPMASKTQPAPYASQPSTAMPPSQPQLPMPPPARPQTSSPTHTRQAPPSRPPMERPASSHIAAPPSAAVNASSTMGDGSGRRSSELDFVAPSNELAQDEFERWKGAPIFRWGANGSILRCSPKRIPIYGGGQSVPKLRCLPGELHFQRTKDIAPDDCQIASFPGPLKSKGKKKEVLAWLSGIVEAHELQAQDIGQYSSPHDHLRAQEKTLLWKCVKVFLEHDGRLSGNANVEEATREILAQSSSDAPSAADPHPSATPTEPQSDRQAIIQQLKQHLLKGEREKAVWIAVDNRLWSHAMLISSTLNSRDVWQQVVQEFVRKDVRSAQHPNQSLAALYEVFAGDWEDSIDQLVPVSARSGFQMVSTADRASQPRDAVDGLNKWRETISLILNNRSTDDEKALLSMGKLLAGYGRIEAAHVCYLFAQSVVHFNGADDANTHITLLGFDHVPADTVVPLDAILLTEVYEFGLMLGSTAASAATPHLQAYKLRHAYALAELGQHTDAIAYCDAIASSISSKTRISPYYHAALLAQLDDLQKRLMQSPRDTAASTWAKAKPSIGKVSKWFDNFVAGDDDAGSNASGYPSDSEGPFMRNLGGTPSISRSASTTDLFGAEFNKAQSAPIPVGGNARYAPAAVTGYAPRASLEADSAGPMSSYSSSPETRHFAYSPRISTDSASQGYGSPPSTSYSFQRQPSGLSHQQTYQPEHQPTAPTSDHGLSAPDFEEQTPVAAYPQPPQQQQQHKTNGYAPSAGSYAPPAFGGYEPSPAMSDPSASSYDSPSASYRPSTSGYDPSTSGYDPSAGGGYEPPSYEPSAPGPQSPGNAPKSRKMFTDEDDDEIMARAAAYNSSHQTSASISTITPSTAGDRAAKDAAADAAFRAAAEADAAKEETDKNSKRSGSGWFKMPSLNPFGGRKQDPNMPQVHKAHMGEENSFYYDEVAKKWVNKKGGANADAGAGVGARGTPPPPRSGPPPMGNRAVSGPPMSSSRPPMSTPPVPPIPVGLQGSGSPSRAGTPGSTGSNGTQPPIGLGLQDPTGTEGGPTSAPGGAGLAPPSRPGTSLSQVSNASSIDDLMGAAAPRQGGKGGTVKKGKKGGNRYVDVMAK